MIKNVKMQVTPEQTRMIQKIVFDNNGTWLNLTKTCDWLIVTASGDISWGTQDVLKCYSEISAEEFISDSMDIFPIYKMQKDGNFIVGFDGNSSGRVFWVKSESDCAYNVGVYRDDWVEFTNSNWRDVEDIKLFLSATQPRIETGQEDLVTVEKEIPQKDIQPGTIVLATRKSTSDKFKDYIWQGMYYGKLNDHYLLDYNGTHYQVADTVEIVPTLTKKEAKQKVSELFANPKNVSSEKIRDIIDLIEI